MAIFASLRMKTNEDPQSKKLQSKIRVRCLRNKRCFQKVCAVMPRLPPDPPKFNVVMSHTSVYKKHRLFRFGQKPPTHTNIEIGGDGGEASNEGSYLENTVYFANTGHGFSHATSYKP
jgi:hypothetical protein